MREQGLLSQVDRRWPELKTRMRARPRSMPNQLWGTDATAIFSAQDGEVTIFAAIDHCTAECLGIQAVKRGHRFEALEPIRPAVHD